MGVVAILAKPKNKNYEYQPFVSIIVTAYNEERTIKKRIDNLMSLNYPKDKYEIIVVESGSTDNTYQIVNDIITNNLEKRPILKIIREKGRKGKPSAINFGKQYAKGDIIMVTDANSVFERNVLKEMIPHFENSRIGAVGGRYIVSNPDNHLTSSESFYWDLEYIMRKGESILDSACLYHGEIHAERKELAEADVNIISHDLDVPIQLRRAGYKIEYEPEAMVYEKTGLTSREQIIRRKKTAIGTMQCIFKHLDYFLLPRDLYSFLIFPSHKALAVFSPLILLSFPILYVIVWDFSVLIKHFIFTLLVFSLMFGLLMFLKSKLTKNGSKFSIFSIPKIAYYVLINEYLILLAWKDFIFKNYSVLWEKADSTRD